MKVTIHTAKTTLSKLIQRAHEGEDVIIARADLPVARLVPIREQAPKRRAGTLRGSVKISKSFFDALPEDELDAWEGRNS